MPRKAVSAFGHSEQVEQPPEQNGTSTTTYSSICTRYSYNIHNHLACGVPYERPSMKNSNQNDHSPRSQQSCAAL